MQTLASRRLIQLLATFIDDGHEGMLQIGC